LLQASQHDTVDYGRHSEHHCLLMIVHIVPAAGVNYMSINAELHVFVVVLNCSYWMLQSGVLCFVFRRYSFSGCSDAELLSSVERIWVQSQPWVRLCHWQIWYVPWDTADLNISSSNMLYALWNITVFLSIFLFQIPLICYSPLWRSL